MRRKFSFVSFHPIFVGTKVFERHSQKMLDAYNKHAFADWKRSFVAGSEDKGNTDFHSHLSDLHSKTTQIVSKSALPANYSDLMKYTSSVSNTAESFKTDTPRDKQECPFYRGVEVILHLDNLFQYMILGYYSGKNVGNADL